VPTPRQARHYRPRSLPERVVQAAAAVGASVALSKAALLAGPALLYPIWGPWVRAGTRNAGVYLKQRFEALGLWRATVLSVRVDTVPSALGGGSGAGGVGGGGLAEALIGAGVVGAPRDTVTLVVGDPWSGGARVDLTLPYALGAEDVVAGEPAELLVLCADRRDPGRAPFRAVREVYLPAAGLWLADYPFVSRERFLDISLAIERARGGGDGAGRGGGGDFGPGGGGGGGGGGFGGGGGGSGGGWPPGPSPPGFGSGFATPAPPQAGPGYVPPSFQQGELGVAADDGGGFYPPSSVFEPQQQQQQQKQQWQQQQWQQQQWQQQQYHEASGRFGGRRGVYYDVEPDSGGTAFDGGFGGGGGGDRDERNSSSESLLSPSSTLVVPVEVISPGQPTTTRR